MKKIIFTTTIAEAEVVRKAISLFCVSCTKATAENPEGIRELSEERMQTLEVDSDEILRLLDFSEWIKTEIKKAKREEKIETLNQKI